MIVFHILNTGSFSGAEHVVMDIITNMPKNIKCYYVALKGEIETKLKELKINYILLDKLSISKLRQLINEYRPNIIHAHDFTASFIASYASKDVKVISHLHNNNPFMKKWCVKSYLYYITLKKYKKILCVSDSVINECIFKEKIEKKSIVVGNPFSSSYITRDIVSYDKIWDVIFVGRLTTQKNPLRFVNLIAKIKEYNSNVKALIVGDGDLRERVEFEIAKFNLQDNIFMVGFQNNPYSYMANSKILFLTSDWEGFGLVVLEALSLGLPPVVTNVGGVKNLLDSTCGCIATSDEDFVQFFKECETNSEMYELQSKNAIKLANKHNNIHTYISNIVKIYNEV